MPSGIPVFSNEFCGTMIFALVFIVILAAVLTFKWILRMREAAALRVFNDAENAEQAKNIPQALALYHQLLADHSSTDYVSKQMKSIIEDRISKLERAS